jgi:DNA invertase Pin-like site-specific DNA recombinase
MTIKGYTASLPGQSIGEQESRLRAAGVRLFYREAPARARQNRPELAKLLERLEAGDVVMVTSIDRLARSGRDLLNILKAIADKGAAFRSLSESWADTSKPNGREVIAILSGLSDFEGEVLRIRGRAGRKRAKARGVRFGRPRKLNPVQRLDALERLRAGETQADVAQTYGVDPTTIGRL